jgi:hypothetical protein
MPRRSRYIVRVALFYAVVAVPLAIWSWLVSKAEEAAVNAVVGSSTAQHIWLEAKRLAYYAPLEMLLLAACLTILVFLAVEAVQARASADIVVLRPIVKKHAGPASKPELYYLTAYLFFHNVSRYSGEHAVAENVTASIMWWPLPTAKRRDVYGVWAVTEAVPHVSATEPPALRWRFDVNHEPGKLYLATFRPNERTAIITSQENLSADREKEAWRWRVEDWFVLRPGEHVVRVKLKGLRCRTTAWCLVTVKDDGMSIRRFGALRGRLRITRSVVRSLREWNRQRPSRRPPKIATTT